jgi:transposase-like protein
MKRERLTHGKNVKRYSKEFIKLRVREYETGAATVRQMCRQYRMHPATVYRWIIKYSVLSSSNIVIVEYKESQTNRIKQLEDKVKELQLLLGKKTVTIDYLEKLIEVASNDLQIDLKKNTDIKQ